MTFKIYDSGLNLKAQDDLERLADTFSLWYTKVSK